MDNSNDPEKRCKTPPHLVEVGKDAVWSVSSCKIGHGVEKLRDRTVSTYWQSDGPQPHTVSIQFPRRISLDSVCFYTDHLYDETYTPKRIAVSIGTGFYDLYLAKTFEFNAPRGWQKMSLLDERNEPVDVFMVQMQILSNHENGRDTHLRQVKVFESKGPDIFAKEIAGVPKFKTIEFTQYATLR